MSLTIGNKTASNLNPNAATWTVAHNGSVGSDGFLLVSVIMTDSVDFTGATYDGDAMTQIDSFNSATLGQRWITYGLLNPSTGNNNIIVSFTGSQTSSSSLFAVSFTNCGGAGNTGKNDVSATPHTETLTVSENSIIYATGASVQGFISITIDSSSRTLEFIHNTGKQASGALSATGLTAGSIDVEIAVTLGTVSNYRVEILEKTSASSGNFMLMF